MSKRLQIDISLESFERLKNLKDKTDSSSYADVTQKAFKVLEYFNKQVTSGNTIQVVDSNGTVTIVEII